MAEEEGWGDDAPQQPDNLDNKTLIENMFIEAECISYS